jgi:hypothetical protein
MTTKTPPARRHVLCALTLLLFGICFNTSFSQNASSDKARLKEVKEAGVSFAYSLDDFDEHTVKTEPKQTLQDVGDGVPEGIAPEHSCFYLKSKVPLPALEKGGRYFFPAGSFICVIPLTDSSVKDFRAAYPDLYAAAQELRKILNARPRTLTPKRTTIIDMPWIEASRSIFSRYQYLNFKSGSGVLFLTQYGQDADPNPVNNEELTCNFQGLTRDGKYYIAARLAISHPSLPRGIDFTDKIKRDKRHLYLRRAETRLNGLPENSFSPMLVSLKALLSSISVQ